MIEGQPKEKDKCWGFQIGWDDRNKNNQPWSSSTLPNTPGNPLAIFSYSYDRFGKKVSIAGCGVAGEYGYGNSGIVFNDMGNGPQPLFRARRPGRGDGQQRA